MSHFKDGTIATVGMRCRFPVTAYEGNRHYETTREGLIYNIVPGGHRCNAQVAYAELTSTVYEGRAIFVVTMQTSVVTLGECERSGGPDRLNDDTPPA